MDGEGGASSLLADNKHQRSRPKHMERILLANHKEQVILQKRLDDINNWSIARGKELNRERFKVNTELQYTKRINFNTATPYLGDIPNLLRDAYPHVPKLDPVTVFLLREYRRNSQVIPDILTRFSQLEEEKRMARYNQENAVAEEETSILHRYRNKDGEPDPHKLSDLVREIARIRREIFTKAQVHYNKTRVTFDELLRYVQDRQQLGSDSDTFTDGTCALLRRKMNKMRSYKYLNFMLEEDEGGLKVKPKPPPKLKKFRKYNKKVVVCKLMQQKQTALPMGRVHTGMASYSRHDRLQHETQLKLQLERQEQKVTDVKVAREVEKYNQIHDRITNFLEESRMKPELPPLFEEERGLSYRP